MDENTDKFLQDVIRGLNAENKFLPSKYFYDQKGDELFRKITQLDAYYLTRCELEILNRQKDRILDYFCDGCELFHLIELGAGDGSKTRVLLEYFTEKQADFVYNPIDISDNALDILAERLEEEISGLKVECVHGEYMQALRNLTDRDHGKKILMFLGSSIGNMNHEQTMEFLGKLNKELNPGDMLFIGFDLKKDPRVILEAYNDKQGITAEFNLNLLKRINKELNGNFNRGDFYHYAQYDPVSGQAKSYLVSSKEQEVTLGNDPRVISFSKDEVIFTEVSRKYDIKMIEDYARESGFSVMTHLFDEKKYFADSIWRISSAENHRATLTPAP